MSVSLQRAAGNQVADVSLAHAWHVGGFAMANSVAIGEHQNLPVERVELRECKFDVV